MEAFSQHEIDLARVAAYIDGEGSIDLGMVESSRRAPAYRIRVTVVNTDIRLPLWCKKTFGGHIKVNHKHHQKHRDVWGWSISHKAATALLKECLPFFIIKREQAELGIAFGETFSRENRSCKGLPQAVKDKRDGLRSKLFEMRRFRPDQEPKSA